jgi:hypothetical protein
VQKNLWAYFFAYSTVEKSRATLNRGPTKGSVLIPPLSKRLLTLSNRKLTVQDILLIQKQLEAAQQLNNLLSDAIAEIGEAVSGIDPGSIRDQKAAAAIDEVNKAVSKLEKKVEEFTKSLK